MTQGGYAIRPIELSDLPAVAALDRLVDRPVNSTFDHDFFSWQFLRSAGRPDAPALSRAAWNGAEAVAFLMMNPVPIAVENRVVSGCHSHEWYAAPGNGFVGLELMSAGMRPQPVTIGAGTSLASAPVIRRIHNLLVVPLHRLALVIDPAATLALSLAEANPNVLPYLKSLVPPRARVVVPPGDGIAVFDDEYDAVWAQMRALVQLATERDARYMNWRYNDHPRFRYHTLRVRGADGTAYFVWRQEEVAATGAQVARLCDAIGTPDAVAAAVPALIAAWRDIPRLAFGDFFCSHDGVLAALLAGGFVHALPHPGLDLARLFSPLAGEVRKTVYFSISFGPGVTLTPRPEPGRFYLTKSDANQDRPNP